VEHQRFVVVEAVELLLQLVEQHQVVAVLVVQEQQEQQAQRTLAAVEAVLGTQTEQTVVQV
jgi:hypothetical protein